MLRRDLLKGGAASLATIAAPRIGRAEKANKLGYVDGENLVLEARVFRGNTLSDVAAQTAELATRISN